MDISFDMIPPQHDGGPNSRSAITAASCRMAAAAAHDDAGAIRLIAESMPHQKQLNAVLSDLSWMTTGLSAIIGDASGAVLYNYPEHAPQTELNAARQVTAWLNDGGPRPVFCCRECHVIYIIATARIAAATMSAYVGSMPEAAKRWLELAAVLGPRLPEPELQPEPVPAPREPEPEN